MTTNQEQPASTTEINAVLEDNAFPAELDWEADFVVRHTPQTGDIRIANPEWEHALIYLDYVKLITDEAMQFYHDTLEYGIVVGYGFELGIKNGETTAFGKLHPTVLDHKGQVAGTLDETIIAEAEVEINFRSNRTAALVRAYIHQHIRTAVYLDESAIPSLLTPDHQLPDDLNYNLNYSVMEHYDRDNPTLVEAEWIDAICAGTSTEAPTLTEKYETDVREGPGGLLYGYDVTYEVDSLGNPVAHMVMCPAKIEYFDCVLDPSDPIKHAEVTLLAKDQNIITALRQYVRAHHSPLPQPVQGFIIVPDGLCRTCFQNNQQEDVLFCRQCEQTFCPTCHNRTSWLAEALPSCPNCAPPVSEN